MHHAGEKPREVDHADAPQEMANIALALPTKPNHEQPYRSHDCPLDSDDSISLWQNDVERAFAPVDSDQVGQHDKETPASPPQFLSA